MERESRKLQHLEFARKQSISHAGFSDIRFVHNCLPEISLDEVELSTMAAGVKLAAPVFINAITGGADEVTALNRDLAEIARRLNLAMAVGSQAAALEKASLTYSYSIVREVNPSGIIWANLGAGASPQEAGAAVKMIDADGIQLHLNAPQELFMPEGDRSFYCLEAIRRVAREITVPVIAKEVGFGMAAGQVKLLLEAGAAAVDVGGAGGTNFIDIECMRSGITAEAGMMKWGNPTPAAVAEAAAAAGGHPQSIMASGGINSALNIVKALALGSSAAGMAAYPLMLLRDSGIEGAVRELGGLLDQIRLIMAMLGCRQVSDIYQIPLIISGDTYHWMQQRGINTEQYARRDLI